MPTKPSSIPRAAAKPAGFLHARNRHQGHYDFARLVQADAALGAWVIANPQGDSSIDFANPAAVKALNRALLVADYGILGWDIPANSLCPSVPGRADYLHCLADLLAASNGGVLPQPGRLQMLDIGTGASCIYPLIGCREYGWGFVATDVNSASLANAQTILAANPALIGRIELRLQPSCTAIFSGIVRDDEWFDGTLCNPPFHASLAEASVGSQRKWRNLGKLVPRGKAHPGSSFGQSPGLNFGGQGAELWCPGGESAFIQSMIEESAQIPTRCFWFSTLVSKAANLPAIYAGLKRAKVVAQRTIEMRQGQKQSRLVAWTFLNAVQQAAWRKLRW